MKWFRLYNETIHDRKLRRLPPAQRWLWIAILCAASDSPDRGRLLLSDGEPVTVDDLADMAALPMKAVRDGLAALERLDMVRRDESVIIVTKWDEITGDARPPAHIWRSLREQVFERDDYTCHYCGSRGVRLECDHVLPVSRGGGHDLDNLVTACFACNRSKRAKTVEEWQA